MKKTVTGIILLALTLTLLSGCTIRLSFNNITMDYYYSDADKYSAGDAEISDKIDSVDINWVAGKVVFVKTSGANISFSEKASSDETEEDLKLRYYVDGTTLRIKFAKSTYRMKQYEEKTLFVNIPEEVSFSTLVINTVSSSVEITDIVAENCDIESVSGSITAELCGNGVADIETVSGAIDATLGNYKNAELESTSGKIKVTADSVTDMETKTTSGSVTVNGNILKTIDAESTSGKIAVTISGALEKAEFKNTSGRIEANLESAESAEFKSTSGTVDIKADYFAVCEAESSSGCVKLNFPDSLGFTATVETRSGSFDCELPSTKNGNKYVVGDGKSSIKLETSSGNIYIGKK